MMPPGMPGPMGPQAPMGMGMADLAPMAPLDTPEGVMLWGNPVLDAPSIPIEQMFAAETAPSLPAGGLDMGMGAGFGQPAMQPAPMDPESARQSAIAMLSQRAKARMGASRGFQEAAHNMAAQQY